MLLVRLAMITCTVLFACSIAHAEHKLLITDVLDAGQVEAEVGFSYDHSTYDFISAFGNGNVTRERFSSLYSLGVGVADGLQIRLRLPYLFHEQRTVEFTSSGDPSGSFGHGGIGDLEIGARYRLIGGDGKPFSMVVGFNVKPQTSDTGRDGTGTTDLSPYVAVDTRMMAGKLRPYASYQAIFRSSGASDLHLLTIGAEYVASPDLSLVPSFQATFRTASDTLTPYESYAGALSGFIQIFHNFYVIPSVNAGFSTVSHTKDGVFDNDILTFVGGGLSFYYLFN